MKLKRLLKNRMKKALVKTVAKFSAEQKEVKKVLDKMQVNINGLTKYFENQNLDIQEAFVLSEFMARCLEKKTKKAFAGKLLVKELLKHADVNIEVKP